MATYNVTRNEDRSIGDLLGDLTRETSQLVREEINLARTEITDKASKASKDIGMVAAGGALAYLGALALVAFFVLGLIAMGLAPWLSALLVAVVLMGIGAGMAMSGINNLKAMNPAPRQTMQSVSQDAQAVKSAVTGGQ
jgi:hypothetical protein